MQLLKAAISRLRPSAATVDGLVSRFFSERICIGLTLLILVVILFIVILRGCAPRDEQGFFAAYGYREKFIAAQFPCPVYRGSPYSDYSIESKGTFGPLGFLSAATERATGRKTSALTIDLGAQKDVLSYELRSLLRHYGLPGRANVLAVYIAQWASFAIIDCRPGTLASLNVEEAKVDSGTFILNLYRNIHGLLATGAVSAMNLAPENIVFNASSAPYSDPLVLSFGEAGTESPASALYRHVRSSLHGAYRKGDMSFPRLLQVLNNALEPTVAIFHSQTHFNVSEVYYCFQGQFGLLSPEASRLLGLYQAAFELRELRPWQEQIIMVYPLSAFGYPTIEYNSTTSNSTWSRLSFWDEPFSIYGWNSRPLGKVHILILEFIAVGQNPRPQNGTQ